MFGGCRCALRSTRDEVWTRFAVGYCRQTWCGDAMNSEARSGTPQFSVETSEVSGGDRLDSRDQGGLVDGSYRPLNRFRRSALRSCDIGVDDLFSATGHFRPLALSSAEQECDPWRGAGRRRHASLTGLSPIWGGLSRIWSGRAHCRCGIGANLQRRTTRLPPPEGLPGVVLQPPSFRCLAGVPRGRR